VRRWPIVLVALLALAAGCLGTADEELQDEDLEDTEEPANRSPALPASVTGVEHRTAVDEVEAGAGLHAEDGMLYVAGQNSGFYVLNASEPGDPEVVGHVPDVYTRGVDLLHYDNRTVAVAASGSGGMTFFDVTDPTQPELVGRALEGEVAVHNVRAVPGEHLVYNSRSLDQPGVDVVDVSDPANPERTTFLAGPACHDVTVGPDAERAYCAAVTETEIWDITDPAEPEVVSRIHNPSINIHHWATVTEDGDTLLIGDEFAGSTDAAAGCGAAQDDPVRGGTASDPVGAVWFYDVSDETQPVPQGYVAPPAPLENAPPAPCTAHFGEILPGRDKVVIGWRAAGTVLVDFQDPSAPAVLDQAQATGDNWEVQLMDGHLFAGDTDRGLDVVAPTGG